MEDKQFFKRVSLSENPTVKEIGIAMSDHMKEWGWLSSYTYKRKEPKHFTAKTEPADFIKQIDFKMYMYYVLTSFLEEGGASELSQIEFRRYNGKGLACAYYSVLFYLLIMRADKENKILNNKKMKYVQGFFKHPLREDVPEFVAHLYGGETQIGLHAFVTINDIVFDFTITQQAHAFDLQQSHVVGNIPEGMEYYGYEESITVVNQYWKMFAEKAEMHPEEWLLRHQSNAMKLFLKDVKAFGQKGMV